MGVTVGAAGAEQTPDLRWFSRALRSLEEGHRVLFLRSLVGVASVERSKVSDR